MCRPRPALLSWPLAAMAAMQFINPPPYGNGDSSQNTVYATGLSSTSSGRRVRLVEQRLFAFFN